MIETLRQRKYLQFALLLVDRLVENLFLRAEQIASAMTVRGFTHPNTHEVTWHHQKLRWPDLLAFGVLLGIWIIRIWKGQAV